MQPVDIFVAAYLVGIMVVLGVLSVLAYRRQNGKKAAGDNEENE